MENRSTLWRPCAIAAFFFVCSAALHVRAADGAGKPAPGKPDLSTPKSAAAAIVKAMEQGDPAVLAAVTVGDAQETQWINAHSAQLRAIRDLDAALAKRFGDAYTGFGAAKEIKDRLAEVADEELFQDLKKAKLGEVKGDEAILVTDERPDLQQPHLARAAGEWKLELSSLADYGVGDGTPMLRAVGKAAASLAHDVSAGKFASLDEATAAIDERLGAAEVAGAAENKKEKQKNTPQPKPPAKKS